MTPFIMAASGFSSLPIDWTNKNSACLAWSDRMDGLAYVSGKWSNVNASLELTCDISPFASVEPFFVWPAALDVDPLSIGSDGMQFKVIWPFAIPAATVEPKLIGLASSASNWIHPTASACTIIACA